MNEKSKELFEVLTSVKILLSNAEELKSKETIIPTELYLRILRSFKGNLLDLIGHSVALEYAHKHGFPDEKEKNQ